MAKSSNRPYEMGMSLLAAGQPEKAVAKLEEACRQDPSNAYAFYQLGNSLRLARRYGQAREALRNAIHLDSGFHDAWFGLAFLHIQLGEKRDAEETLLGLARQAQHDIRVQLKAASLLAGTGLHQAAARLYQSAIALDPARPGLHLQLGIQLQKLGRYEEAESAFRRVIEMEPENGAAYLLLANCRRIGQKENTLLEMYESALQRPGLDDEARACLHFGLGKLHDDWQEYDKAYGHYRQANALRHKKCTFDPKAWDRQVDNLIQSFRTMSLSPITAVDDSPAPGFIIGMPRSGTTLVERIITVHADTASLGETELLDAFVRKIEEFTGAHYPECLSRLSQEDLGMISRDYRHQVAVEIKQARIILDKNPMNFMHVGLIALLFPDASIVHCRRDPLDVCLSIYFQDFAHDRNQFAYDLQDIAAFYAGYQRLMAAWASLFPGRLIHVDYEKLVMDPERESRRLYEALSLEWIPDAIRPEANPANISTASLWQARQPIYAHAAGRWRHYEKFLAPLSDVLSGSLSITGSP